MKPMAKRPSADAWTAARLRWEADPTETFESIAKWMGEQGSPVSRVAASKRAAKEAWARPTNLAQINEQAQLQADAKVSPKPSEVSDETLKKTAEQAAVQVRAAVLELQREDWKLHRESFTLESVVGNFEKGKEAKISAEMLAIRHRGEREAYGMEVKGDGGGKANGLPSVSIRDLTGRKTAMTP
jgi:hypothetical protein